jgi:hypothetical protein
MASSSADGQPPSASTHGPEHWAIRRSHWLAASPSDPAARAAAAERHTAVPPEDQQRRLVDLLDGPGAEESDEVWHGGLDKIAKSLLSGVKLRRPLPLATTVSVPNLKQAMP